MNNTINKYFVREYLEMTLSQVGHFYKPTKANKKKVVDYFNSLPFFFLNENIQNVLYKSIAKHNIHIFVDTRSDMKDFCYNVYETFCLQHRVSPKTFSEFYENIENKLYSEEYFSYKERQAHIHTFVFVLFVIFLVVFYYTFSKRLY